MNAFTLLGKTFQFVLIRMMVNVLMLVPGYYAMVAGVKFMRKLTGVEGIFLFDIAFSYVGFVTFILYINFVRKFVNHIVRYAQVASATDILNGGKGGVGHGFKTMFSRFGSVSGMYLADKVMTKVFTKVSAWVVDNSDFVPDFFKQGRLSRFFNSVVRAVIFHIDEAVVSHMYSKPEISAWDGIVEGTGLYFKSWRGVMKSAFFSVLWLKVAGWLANVIVIVGGIWLLWGEGWYTILVFFIAWKLIATLVKATIIEPYQTLEMLVGFHSLKEKEGDAGIELLDEVKGKIVKFKDIDNETIEALSSAIVDKMSGFTEGGGVFSKSAEVLGKMKASKTESGG